MRVIMVIFASIILLFFCALILMWMPLPKPFPPPLSKGRNLMSAAVVGVLGMADVVALAIYVIFLPLQAGRALDAVLGPAGFVSQGYMIFGRRYTGRYKDKAFEVQYFPPQRSRAAVLDVYVRANTGTRMALGRQRPLLDCRDCVHLAVSEPDLDGLAWFAENEPRARSLIADQQVRAALARLVRDPPESVELYVQPERIWFRAHVWQLSDEQLWQWFDDISVVVAAVE